MAPIVWQRDERVQTLATYGDAPRSYVGARVSRGDRAAVEQHLYLARDAARGAQHEVDVLGLKGEVDTRGGARFGGLSGDPPRAAIGKLVQRHGFRRRG